LGHFSRRREILQLDPTARALIVQDGLKCYFQERIKKALESFFIDTIDIPPHSSHLLQPLDLVTNPSFKSHLRKYKSAPTHLCDRSKRIYNVLYSMQKNINPLQNLRAFESAGIIFSFDEPHSMKFDLKKITDKSLSPQENEDSNTNVLIPEKPKQIQVRRHNTEKEKRQEEKNSKIIPKKRIMKVKFNGQMIVSGTIRNRQINKK